MSNASRSVVALTPHACVTIDYDTGRTELRPLSGQPPAGTVVQVAAAVPTWGTTDAPATLPRWAPVPLRWRLAALPAVLLTTAVRTCGPRRRRFRRLVRLACCGRYFTPATTRQVHYAVRATRWASRAIPTRWACLEQSAAAAVLLALAGRRGEWRHGVATDPIRLHAWLVNRYGRPVEEPPDTSLYTPTHTPDGPGPDLRDRRETPP
ncbi:lasso peptide biosynthesis B2 protein [Streptomyces sp. 4503]|uniref:Lasso peptide biosynthesis B2 protein n=1 Tax=Streptomyces niphimycinicus TaxID=2842201 RepID=A0ABS6C9K2_9ACTN|nr:lasso peptide biosynthesis B2 protein [Streptomyces niphimycinicus]MBU3863574.1 lasso peptide biosynthesis B2 protein [Streptomyces niphimycinicus]